jgi:hypothetical protein
MPQFDLTLRVDAPGPAGGMLGEESNRVRQRVYAALKMRSFSVAWITLRLGTAKSEAALDLLLKEFRAGTALIGSAYLAESLAEDEAPESDWTLLSTRQVSGSFSLWDDYPQCRAGTVPKVHALNHTFVSEQFVAACERDGLRGVEFLRCRNSGRKAGPPWFVALPAHSLGNGLDHPWLDRARWAEHVRDYSRRRHGAVATGQNQFHQFWLRREAQADPLLARMLQLCPMPARAESGLDGLKLAMVPRYLASAEPPEDFAYIPWGEDGPNREGKMMRFRQLAVRRRARDALLGAGLFKPRDFLRLRSVAAPEPGVDNLDQRHGAVPPMYSAQELAALRAQESRL